MFCSRKQPEPPAPDVPPPRTSSPANHCSPPANSGTTRTATRRGVQRCHQLTPPCPETSPVSSPALCRRVRDDRRAPPVSLSPPSPLSLADAWAPPVRFKPGACVCTSALGRLSGWACCPMAVLAQQAQSPFLFLLLSPFQKSHRIKYLSKCNNSNSYIPLKTLTYLMV